MQDNGFHCPVFFSHSMKNSITIYNGNKLLILLHEKAEVPALEDLLFFTHKNDVSDVVHAFLHGKEKHICFTGDAPLNLLESLKEHFTFIEAAGGLVKNQEGKFLFIYRLDKWDLPKGKAEKGELPEQTAVREVQEETGLEQMEIVQPLKNTYHIYPLKNKVVLKCTYWFEMEHKGTGKVTPQTTENIEKVVWVDQKEFPSVLENTYPSIADLLNSL